MKSTVSQPPSSALALVPSGRLIVLTAATALIASLSLAFSTPATISVDGQRLASDVAPVTTLGGAAYLPLRAVADAAGAQTSFDTSTGEIVVRRGTDVLVMRAGVSAAKMNGRTVTLAHAPFTAHKRTMVAGDTIATTFGSTVRFDRRHDRVVVRTPGVVMAGAADDTP
jgi:hypothetical protein